MDSSLAEEIVCDWMYRDQKYSMQDLFLVENAIKYRIKNKETNFWELMFYYYSNNQYKMSLANAHKYYDYSVKNKEMVNVCTAANWIGDHYLYGLGTVKDYKKAYNYYIKALEIDKESPYALFDLAIMYRNGYYVEKNIDKYHDIIIKLFNNCDYKDGEENDSFESMSAEIYQHYAYYLLDKGGTSNIRLAKKYLKKSREEIVTFLYYNDWDSTVKQLIEVDDNIRNLNNQLLDVDLSNEHTCIIVSKKFFKNNNSLLLDNCINDYKIINVKGDIYTLIDLPKTNKEYVIKFKYNNETYTIFAKKYETNKMYYKFLDNNYRNMEELVRKAVINNIEIRQLQSRINLINIII